LVDILKARIIIALIILSQSKITYDSHLKFDLHINDKINKACSILGIIRGNFAFLDKDSVLLIYKFVVRSHLVYANCIWSPHTVIQFERKKI